MIKNELKSLDNYKTQIIDGLSIERGIYKHRRRLMGTVGENILPTTFILPAKTNEFCLPYRFNASVVVGQTLQVFGRDFGKVYYAVAKLSNQVSVLSLNQKLELYVPYID